MHMELYSNNKTMKLLLILRFFHYIWLIDSEYSHFERKYYKVLTFNIVHFPNFEMSTSLLLSLPSNKHHTEQFKNLISAGGAY